MTTQNRPHDYIYDTTYTVSSVKDHYKAMMKSRTHDVIINPVYENMFSDLRHFPPSQYHFRQHKLPEMLGNDRRVFHGPADVEGSNRYKYFRRPIIPYMPSLGGQIVYARKQAPVVQTVVERPASPPAKTVAVQTIYRESEAQTDPYSPDYVLPPGASPPELLALATLTFGMGLPAGMAELEMIERARAKRAWEAKLPQVVDSESFEKRLKMMEEMELREWQERENEIRRLQEARLKILSHVISKREQENEAINNERVQRIWQKKLQEREAMLEKIDRKRLKALRKLAENRSKVEPKVERRDIIADYANYSSRVYAPKARDGVFFDNAATTLKLKIEDLDTYTGLTELETTFSPSVLNANISLPAHADNRRNPEVRRELHLQEQLKLMDEKMKGRKMVSKMEEKPLRFAQRVEKPPQRPPTPKIREPLVIDEQMETAAILLQKLIRGRISQNMMYQGKERRLQLINELRTRHTIRKAQGYQDPIFTKHAAAELAEGVDSAEYKSSRGGSASGQPGVDVKGDNDPEKEMLFTEGEEYEAPKYDITSPEYLEKIFEGKFYASYIGRTLDFLSKELVRLREERRISAMVRLAERTRKLREAEESDRREQELERRTKEDDVFKRMMRIHQDTLDSYLEDVIAGSVDSTSSLQSRQEVREYITKINSLVDEMERRGPSEVESMVADLVASFLIPEVERQDLRDRIKQDQRKYLLAAHQAVYSEISHVEDKNVVDAVEARKTHIPSAKERLERKNT